LNRNVYVTYGFFTDMSINNNNLSRFNNDELLKAKQQKMITGDLGKGTMG